ncbi:TPA: DNA methyltransferase [Acinetobacter baumannii]
MNSFITDITNINPEHDYPAGLIHPYWARKPLNVIESVIKHFSKPGDYVLDPFMGSGTTLIAALKMDRNAIGNDLNPLSKLIVDVILNSRKSPSDYRTLLKNVSIDWMTFAIDLYKLSDKEAIERENFKVNGTYIDGNFTLTPIEAKVKSINKNDLKGTTFIVSDYTFLNTLPNNFINYPLNFKKINFLENTRIAVHRGVNADHFFTTRNKVFINYCLNYIDEKKLTDEEEKFLRLLLSSLLPLLRLSDKKASSQWPYWRPKDFLTSRNPCAGLKKRIKAFDEMIVWVGENLDNESLCKTYCESVTDLNLDIKADLIVTDPPYADHAPYLEYAELFCSIALQNTNHHLFHKEIVKTNAIGRANESNLYEQNLYLGFTTLLDQLKQNGHLVFFYVDKNIEHWKYIKKAIEEKQCTVKEVIGIKKQRRSMKTVTSPGKTLDGDLIVIVQKRCNENYINPNIQLNDLLSSIPQDIQYFDKFAIFIKNFLKNDIIFPDTQKLTDLSKVLH